MERKHKFNVYPTAFPGKKWFLIGLWSRQYSDGTITQDVWISGELNAFIEEYKSGVREFGTFSIAEGAQVKVNSTAIEDAFLGEILHVPERVTIVDGTVGEIAVEMTAGYGQVPPGPVEAMLVKQNPPDDPNATVIFWAPRAVAE